jgi:hypothetical protein
MKKKYFLENEEKDLKKTISLPLNIKTSIYGD